MEHHMRTEGAEHIIKTGFCPDVADDRNEIERLEPLLKFETEVVHRCFSVVEKDELSRAERSKLTAELGTYRTGSTCHHDGLAVEVLDNLLHRNLYLVTTEKVFDLHLTDRRFHYLTVNHLVDARSHQHLHMGFLTVVDEP